MKKISIVSSCFNEQDNVEELCARVKAEMERYEGKYDWEQILLDNHSTDNTAAKLRELAKNDFRVKVIFNARNFGHIRSPLHGLFEATGDAIIMLASDLQDPPELIHEFIEKWESGSKIVVGVKNKSEEFFVMSYIRKAFYNFLKKISDDGTDLVKNFTGFGLYSRDVIDIIKDMDDPYPYFRGVLCEIGFDIEKIEFVQPRRKRGKTKNNFYTLYDNAMLGIVKHSKAPLRIMAFCGFLMSFLSLFTAIGYFILKLVFWNSFEFGLAPIIISLFFLGAVQLFCLGVLGEYVGAIYSRVDKKPLAVEKERINF